jgi:predicted nucleic acid-binding protein
MIVLDTNVMSELMKPLPADSVRNWLMSLGDMALGTTAVTLAEIEFGLQRLPDGKRRAGLFARFEIFASSLTILPLDDPAAREAGRLWAMRLAAGLPSQPCDMLIAGITACAGETLATRNTRDFAALPLQLVDPWQA